DIGDLTVCDVGIETIRTKNYSIALKNRDTFNIDADYWFMPNAARQDRPVLACLGILFRNQPELLLHACVRMVCRQLLDLSLADQVYAGIAHIARNNFVVAKYDNSQSCRHTGFAVVRHPFVVYRKIGRVEHLSEQLLGGLIAWGFAKSLERRFHSEPARHLSIMQSTHAVSKHGYRTVAAFLIL